MDVNLILNNPRGYANSRVFKKNWPEDYEKVVQCFGDSFAEQLYNYIYPNEKHQCKVCGKPTKFRSLIVGYSPTCSVKCGSANPDRAEKIKNTCQERYGVDNPKQLDEFKAKAKATCIERYGTDNFIDLYKEKIIEKYGTVNVSQLESIREKIKQTNLKRYGVEYTSQNKEVRNKIRNTVLERYGVECVFQNKDIKDKIRITMLEKYGVDNVFKLKEFQDLARERMIEKYGVAYPMWYPAFKEKLLKTIQEKYGVNNAFQLADIRPCWKSSYETTICNWLDKFNIKYETSNRKILHGKELDIYIPEKKIAIEVNGVYWHSSVVKGEKYHVNKYKECKKNGIQLISIWEDWIINAPEKCKAIILSKLGIYSTRLFARECEIKIITSKQANRLYDKYHIQGKCSAKIHYGLFYKDELLSAMSFSKSHKNINHGNSSWELIRYCCKEGVQIVAGTKRLFSHFIKDYNATQVYSHSLNDISNGNLYLKLGFELVKTNDNSYWYIGHDPKRYHRYNFSKASIKKKGINIEGKTEAQIMAELPYHKIFDSGTKIWVWKKES